MYSLSLAFLFVFFSSAIFHCKFIRKAKNFKFVIFQGLARTRHADADIGLGDVVAVGVTTSKQTVGKPANCVKSSKRLNGIREVNRANPGLASSFRSVTRLSTTPVLLRLVISFYNQH